jgi:NAD(P)-dependent dehydrogenase (short-subunit alcohol dehydrogenase family)
MFNGQIAVISGSAAGIGEGIALGLAQRGADIVGLDIDTTGNRGTAEAVRKLGRKALAIECDVGDAAQVKAAFDHALKTFGRIDILINNAAVWLDCALTTGSYESQTRAFADSMNICALGSYYCARAAVSAMITGGGGNIVNIVTEHIKEGRFITGMPASGYDCAKWSQWRLTQTWAMELKKHKIRVNALCTGAVDTPMLRAVSEKIAAAGMKPEDMAQAVVNVLAHGAAGPTGQSYFFGFTGNPRNASLQEIAALAP